MDQVVERRPVVSMMNYNQFYRMFNHSDPSIYFARVLSRHCEISTCLVETLCFVLQFLVTTLLP